MEELTPKIFNEKYKDYLEDRHYGLDIYETDVITFLDEIFENVLTKIPGFKYTQIKLKFGKSRFYSNIGSIEMERLIENKINDIIHKTHE
jgi:hypothetical protein